MLKTMLLAGALVGCTAKTISPPLTARGSPTPLRTFSGVRLTSGAFHDPHRVIGVIQMTQSGFKWMHEIEVVDDANPASLLFKIGSYAHEHGADGVQHLELIDLDPQTPADKVSKQIDSAVTIQREFSRGNYLAVAGEGTETRWEVRGELIKFEGAQ